jgi:CRISPR-associated protein Cas1
MFPHRTDSLIISGVVSISGAAMRLLMKYQINTLFISSNGRFNGKLVFTSAKNILLRKKQYTISDNEQ